MLKWKKKTSIYANEQLNINIIIVMGSACIKHKPTRQELLKA